MDYDTYSISWPEATPCRELDALRTAREFEAWCDAQEALELLADETQEDNDEITD